MNKNAIQPIPISHELSNIGKLDFQFHGIAALFYAQLQTDGIIDYLKGLDHLGFISKCHPGNHHKRWDYVCLQLYFLQKLRHSAFNTGLTKDIEINGTNASYLEILQTFILFANIGHLEGTVASEKGLFKFLEQNAHAKGSFLGEIDNIPELKAFADKIFTSFDFYKVKYLVALNYVLQRKVDARILASIQLILKKYLHEKDIAFEKLRILYFKVRKVSFVYLDSFHCSTPVQVNLSKILVNIFNYDNLFNPDDTDYDSILEACETVLSKELYISPKSSMTFSLSSREFCNYLISRSNGSKPIDHSIFIISLLKQKENYTIKFPDFEKFYLFHFYVSKDSLKIFEAHLGVSLDDAIITLNKVEDQLRKTLNKSLTQRKIEFTFQHDMRKSMLFFTVLVPKNIVNIDSKQILINFNNFFANIVNYLNFDQYLDRLGLGEHPIFASLFHRNLQKDIIRRYFLYVLKLLFEKSNRLNLFIKFQYRQLINEMNKRTGKPLFETFFAASRSELLQELNDNLNKGLPEDIENNVQILKRIISDEVKLKRNFCAFTAIFPIEIEEMIFDAGELDKWGNSERRRTITDIDSMLIVFQKSKFELYIIEGKKYRSGFKSACTRDLNNIRALANNAQAFSPPVLVQTGSFKGGYIKITVP
jgi:hypothetical protein